MQTDYYTFDYAGITHPETGDEYDDPFVARAQWRKEFEEALDYLPEVLGYRVLVGPAPWRAVVRFLSAEGISVDQVQEHLYDEGGLSGNFTQGQERCYRVEYLVPTVEDIVALNEDVARDRFNARSAVKGNSYTIIWVNDIPTNTEE